MFCIYAMYDRPQVDALIDCYFTEGCPQEGAHEDLRIHCGVRAFVEQTGGSTRAGLGVEFGEYSLKQYRYAKDYY